MTDLRKQAEELARQPYTVIVFRDATTDEEPIYVARNPELEGCIAQGDTIKEAQDNLDEFRVNYIQHLLEHGLSIPEPEWKNTVTLGNSFMIETERPAPDEAAGSDNPSGDHNQVFQATLKT